MYSKEATKSTELRSAATALISGACRRSRPRSSQRHLPKCGQPALAAPTTKGKPSASRHQGNPATPHRGCQDRIQSRRRRSEHRGRAPGALAPHGTHSSHLDWPEARPPPPPRPSRAPARLPHVSAVIVPGGIPPRPRLSSPALPGTLAGCAAEGSHARARTSPPAAESFSSRGESQPSPALLPASFRRRLLSPAAAAARRTPLRVLSPPAAVPRRGAVGACAEPPPPRPRPASVAAAAAAAAPLLLPSPLQCEGLEDGRLAELRG